MKVSVCMATFNGQPYLEEQLRSILVQLQADDEFVVVDDASTDQTIQLLRGLQDPRVRIFRNERNLGHVATFARAISLANNDVIFMSDQDDRWTSGRLQSMLARLHSTGAVLVSSNTSFIDGQGQPTLAAAFRLKASDSDRHLRNILGIFSGRTGYYGCAMAFRSDLRTVILPIPSYVESHDLWIAIAGNLIRRNTHLEDDTLERRVHAHNASLLRRSLVHKLRSRVVHALSVLTLAFRAQRSSGRSRA